MTTPRMEIKNVETVLQDMRVDGWPGVYVLGCLDRRVTIYSQQVRALNLAAALFEGKKVAPGDSVVVVGAGAAGLTCAAGLHALGATVTVLEKDKKILPIFRGGSTRWLHPGVYDWPREGWSRDRAGLPLLDWEHGKVDSVLEQFETAWKSTGLEVISGSTDIDLGDPSDEPRTILWEPHGELETRTVVLAVGFGLEATPTPTERRYWEGDDFDASRLDGKRTWLVSGCGDGALTDLLRLCLGSFKHDQMLRDFTLDERMGPIRDEIRKIEADAGLQSDPKELHKAYATVHAPWVREQMEKRRRTDTEVTLNAPTEFLTRGASALNRFLVGQMHQAKLFKRIRSRMGNDPVLREDGLEVSFASGKSKVFHRLVRRHGPKSALAEGFPRIAQALENERERRRDKLTLGDQTRERFWREGLFGRETRERPLGPELDRYRATVEERNRELHLAGFGTKVRFPIALDDLHVPLQAAIDLDLEHDARIQEPERRVPQDDELECGPGGSEEIPLSKAFEVATARGKRGVVLLGHPGSGKTTHLQQVLLKVVRDRPESIGLPPDIVPVFLPLRRIGDLEGGLQRLVEKQLDASMVDAAPGFGRRMWDRGNLLLLFDGLDEVADARQRREVARLIGRACKANERNRFIVTCRITGYSPDARSSLRSRCLGLEIRSMDAARVETFIRKWYATVERATGGDDRSARAKADRLLTTLQATRVGMTQLYEMTRNPLLLTTICLVHRDRGELPEERVVLYEEAVSVLLEGWRRVFKKLEVTFPAREARLVLQPVAGHMHERKKRQATAPELNEVVDEALALIKRTEVSASELLSTIRDESGLLTGLGVDEFGFMHLGFQEYLTARHLRGRAFSEPKVLEWLAGRFDDSWWQEVILLLLADGDPPMFKEFMGALVQRPEFARWANSEMMEFCWREALGVTVAPFIELLGQADEDETLEARKHAAVDLLERRMPEALEGLDEHPMSSVRQWWTSLRRGAAETSMGVGLEAKGSARVEFGVKSSVGRTVGGVELIEIPGERFSMGSPPDDEMGFARERPQHEVELASFYLARTPVTNAQYREYVKEYPDVREPKTWGDRRYNHPDQPVAGVSWQEARLYCERMGFVLPTEAQWEYACRAGMATRYHSGDMEQDLAKVGWYDENSGGRLHGVAELEPNGFGLYDMHGNVFEWCLDAFTGYETSPRAGDGLRREPVGDASRVLRGGNFRYPARSARSAYRYYRPPDDRGVYVGFRPAQVVS